MPSEFSVARSRRVGGLRVGRADRQRRATSPPRALRKWAAILARALVVVAAWQFMTAAMMLPSSLGFIRFMRRPPPRAGLPLALLCSWAVTSQLDGVCVGWRYRRHAGASSRRCVALAGDARGADTGGDARSRRYLSVHAAQGCLPEIVSPSSIYLMRHYRRGALNGWRLGFGHALYCVGCCWALML